MKDNDVLQQDPFPFLVPVSKPVEEAFISAFNLACATWIERGEKLPEPVEARYMANIQGEA